jgi:hypothetical protein
MHSRPYLCSLPHRDLLEGRNDGDEGQRELEKHLGQDSSRETLVRQGSSAVPFFFGHEDHRCLVQPFRTRACAVPELLEAAARPSLSGRSNT